MTITRLRAFLAMITLILALIGMTGPAPATADNAQIPGQGSRTRPSTTRPTVVLVHGAFADSSGWSSVATGLQAAGYPVIAFSNPLRGVSYDSAYLRAFLATISGPIVLVGHSYGGAVITDAATGNPEVRSLVYIAAFAPDKGETVQDAGSLAGGHTDLGEHLVFRPFPGAAEGDADASIDPAHFRQLFAQDLPVAITTTMAAAQRPAALAAFGTPSGVPAWRTIPSWYLVAKQDRTIAPAAERAMARRAGATTVEINSSHVAMISHPVPVISLIKQAAK